MPSTIRMSMSGPRIQNPLEYGDCLKGVVYSWLGIIAPDLHDLNQLKPVSVGPLQTTDSGGLEFEVSVLTDGLEIAALAKIASESPVWLHRSRSEPILFQTQRGQLLRKQPGKIC